jgi:type II secretory pathway component PulK
MTRDDRRGVALVIVLALMVALGGIAAAVGRAVRLENATVETLRARTVARYAAESGVVAAEWRIQALLDSLPSLPERAALFGQRDGWLPDLAEVPLGDARFTVTVADLNARIDLNRSDSATLRGLFAQFTSESRAAEIVSAIRARPPYRVSELAAVPGVSAELATQVAPYVTVWSDGTININSAPERVLAALPSLGAAGARNLIARREDGEILSSTESVHPAGPPMPSPAEAMDEVQSPESALDPIAYLPRRQGPLLTTAPSRLLVVSRGWKAGHPLSHEVQGVYAVMGARLTLQAWQERDR